MLKFIVNILITSLIMYNTYNSFKARRLGKHLRVQYSHYFKIMCIFLVFDNLFSFFLRFIPFYQVGRLLMVVWLSVPMCSGAAFVYRFYVNGFLKVYEQDLDLYISKLKEKILFRFQQYYNYANNKYREGRNRKKIEDSSAIQQNEESPEMGIKSRSIMSQVSNKPDYHNEDINSSMDEVSNVSNDELVEVNN
ncbi:Receptor expression-enhancing protein 4 [Nosema granulosis]|uniref:Protein YOP1 n=1 Tax=Nosema granulosis TaxID=83296 RepID=A0A9P6GZZ6_9MICR|nr:Receptor expression-enhancing protein 4 [Nosema granulosis]